MNSKISIKDFADKQLFHIKVLEDRVFEIKKYPSFKLLIDGLKDILLKCDKSKKQICILERTKLYGSSLFGGLFEKAEIISYDCSPSSANERGDYNSFMVDDKNFIKFQKIESLSQDNTFKLPENKFDLIFIPNLIHHFKDQEKLFSECFKSLKAHGELKIFEPTIREIHQAPHDYLRYTPHGIEEIYKRNKFTKILCHEIGDSFEALNYIINVMRSKRDDEEFSKWCDKFTMSINEFKKGKKDIVKKHARFPTAFFCSGIKNA